MKPMTAHELKNSTGEVIRALRRGESILLTLRGKALGTIEPFHPDSSKGLSNLSYEEAWAEIEAQLRQSRPRFASWREAEDQGRGQQ